MFDYIVEIVDSHTGSVICEQRVQAYGPRDACSVAMTGRDYHKFEAGYAYRED